MSKADHLGLSTQNRNVSIELVRGRGIDRDLIRSANRLKAASLGTGLVRGRGTDLVKSPSIRPNLVRGHGIDLVRGPRIRAGATGGLDVGQTGHVLPGPEHTPSVRVVPSGPTPQGNRELAEGTTIRSRPTTPPGLDQELLEGIERLKRLATGQPKPERSAAARRQSRRQLRTREDDPSSCIRH
jgi:hypothetical protein